MPDGGVRLSIWRPDPAQAVRSNIARFGHFVTKRTAVEFDSHLDLWKWSVDHLEELLILAVHTDHANRVAGLLKRDGVPYDLARSAGRYAVPAPALV